MTTTSFLPGLRAGVWAALVALLLTTGCATRSDVSSRDPFERWNRGVSEFNDNVDSLVLKPVAIAYREVTPPMVRTGVSNFFGNLGDFWSFVNSALQFKFQNAADNFMRLNVNTFFGLGGILDIASDLNIERHREDFGQTLGRWGIGPGPFIMLPLLGPSTLRDTLALPVDMRFNPLRQISNEDVRYGFYGLRTVNTRANLLRVGTVLEEAALDKYSFTRDAHLQRRSGEIYDSGPRSRDSSAGSDSSTPAPDAGQPVVPPQR